MNKDNQERILSAIDRAVSSELPNRREEVKRIAQTVPFAPIRPRRISYSRLAAVCTAVLALVLVSSVLISNGDFIKNFAAKDNGRTSAENGLPADNANKDNGQNEYSTAPLYTFAPGDKQLPSSQEGYREFINTPLNWELCGISEQNGQMRVYYKDKTQNDTVLIIVSDTVAYDAYTGYSGNISTAKDVGGDGYTAYVPALRLVQDDIRLIGKTGSSAEHEYKTAGGTVSFIIIKPEGISETSGYTADQLLKDKAFSLDNIK